MSLQNTSDFIQSHYTKPEDAADKKIITREFKKISKELQAFVTNNKE